MLKIRSLKLPLAQLQATFGILNLAPSVAICEMFTCTTPHFAQSAEQQAHWHQQGVKAFLMGEDRGIIFKTFKNQLEILKQTK